MKNPTSCSFCGNSVSLKSNSVIYGREYGNGKAYICDNFPTCDSYVGTHANGETLGIIANAEMRELKKQCHALFDPLWKSKQFKRQDCYGYLAIKLDMRLRDCHFGWFDTPTLKRALNVLKNEYNYELVNDYVVKRLNRKKLEKGVMLLGT